MASGPLARGPAAAFTRFRRGRSPRRRPSAAPHAEEKEAMPDLAHLALTVACFIVLALVVKAVEKL
ncbi:hypothetical protein LO763_05005 [Glycomyces sp. A-F 0318]|uniref:hypothetical protein n=1 Tax=Glycomyces amatae TaxID=2881355 RepID=UPI001E5A041A|nr:hypothetical protein [Glycomyces amatae]MCD0442984.1 hypothetical protein [Glycomyces amatae]